MDVKAQVRIGTAGWSIPGPSSLRFPGPGTHLQRYASVFSCAEINSTFHRSHAASTYERWASATPPSFRFSVKLPRTITHEQRLRRAGPLLEKFFAETAALGDRRGPILVQLPPSLEFDSRSARAFFERLRSLHEGPVVFEPRNATWFLPRAESLLERYHIARVAADPAPVERAAMAGGWAGLAYYRLHGSPRKYWSSYPASVLADLHAAIAAHAAIRPVWCIFDNTASGAAIANARDLDALLSGSRP